MNLAAGAMLLGHGFAPMVVSASPASVSGSDSGSTVTTNATTALVTGGSGAATRTHSWSLVSGSGSITATSPSSATTNFSASGLSPGGSLSAVFKDTITDTVTGQVIDTNTVNVYVERSTPPLSMSGPAGALGTVISSTPAVVTASTSVSASGGVGTITYSATSSGDFTMTGSGSSRSFWRELGPGGGVEGTVTFTATDSIGQSVSATAPVVLINNGTPPPPLTVSLSTGSVEGYNSDIVVVTGEVTATPSGGSGSYVSGSWSRIGGSGSPTSGGATAAFTDNVGYGDTTNGTFRYTVTDSLGNTASATVSATFTNWGSGPGGFA